MRIVGGRLRGRSVKGPSTLAVRPTSDRLRESIFNILTHAYDDPITDARVIDLFAGAGGLGLEAMSRGARQALFIDDGSEARALLRANVESLGLGGETRIFRRDATKLGAMPPQDPYTLAFLDPPYGKNLVAPALVSLRDGGWLAKGALCVIEETSAVELELPEPYKLLERREFGDTRIWFVVYSSAEL